MTWRTDAGHAAVVVGTRKFDGGNIMLRIYLTLLLVALSAAQLVTTAHASGGAAGKGAGAARSALDGGGGCESRPEGKAVRDCVADVLDRLAAENAGSPQRHAELQRAASAVRAATSKAQALLALTRCQSVITAALKQASATGERVRGFGRQEGLGRISSVLAIAIRLIQRKG